MVTSSLPIYLAQWFAGNTQWRHLDVEWLWGSVGMKQGKNVGSQQQSPTHASVSGEPSWDQRETQVDTETNC